MAASARGRFCDTVAGWVAAQIRNHAGFTLDAIDPATGGPEVEGEGFRRRIGGADAFLIVVPEYNHSYPGALKTLIDSASAEWRAKPVAFVSYGGVSGGLRAVEHLRGVFAELHAVGIRDCVCFPNAREQFDAAGRLINEPRYARAMDTLLSRLGWWGRGLRAARETESYGEAA